mgnify:CR=1 FL=1
MNLIQKNFENLIFAAQQTDEDPCHPNGLAVVICKDFKGRSFPVLCLVFDHQDEGTFYTPYALMIDQTIAPLINKLVPPEGLKGEWTWKEKKKT